MDFDWNSDKNTWLSENRGVSFEEIICLIEDGHLKAILRHPKRPGQKILIVERDGYAFNVPFVEQSDGTCYLKTIYPSRICTKLYIQGYQDEKDIS